MSRMTEKEMKAHKARLARFIIRWKIKTKYGMLVLYKAVREDLGSWWTGGRPNTRSSVSGVYTPGTEVKCRRCNRNPYDTCGQGLHVSTKNFARKFQRRSAPTIVQVLVDPKDVVCVPFDWPGKPVQKIRVKRLYVDKIVVKDKSK